MNYYDLRDYFDIIEKTEEERHECIKRFLLKKLDRSEIVEFIPKLTDKELIIGMKNKLNKIKEGKITRKDLLGIHNSNNSWRLFKTEFNWVNGNTPLDYSGTLVKYW